MKNIFLRKYKKIYIIGPTGSGKTTLAKKLSTNLNYPHFQIDKIKWNHNTKVIRPKKESIKILNDILSKNKTWIIEGAQWQDWTDKIWENCDIVIMPYPYVTTRIFYILKRYILRTEAKEKTMSMCDILNNIRFSLKFKKCYLPKFEACAKKYNKQIIDTKTLII